MKKKGVTAFPEIMIPLVTGEAEWEFNREIVVRLANEVMKEQGIKVRYLVGTMIEIPRACFRAGEIAESAEFFSFGTNDLTQMTYGLSRDDAGRFLPEYIEKNLIGRDPFVAIDREGVGEIVEIAIKRGKAVRKNLEVGICGEHGGEPSSVEFCHMVKMDYVSCAPPRAPIARLAAAQATITHGKYKTTEIH
jgi:pyruvate,orthophosphate dikinase